MNRTELQAKACTRSKKRGNTRTRYKARETRESKITRLQLVTLLINLFFFYQSVSKADNQSELFNVTD